jgi:hypothetical protein
MIEQLSSHKQSAAAIKEIYTMSEQDLTNRQQNLVRTFREKALLYINNLKEAEQKYQRIANAVEETNTQKDWRINRAKIECSYCNGTTTSFFDAGYMRADWKRHKRKLWSQLLGQRTFVNVGKRQTTEQQQQLLSASRGKAQFIASISEVPEYVYTRAKEVST